MQSGSSILIEEPSLSEHIDGLIGLLLGRLHIETGRFHEGIVFGGGIIVDEEEDDSEATLPLSLIVLLRDGKLSQRSRLIAMPAASANVQREMHETRKPRTRFIFIVFPVARFEEAQVTITTLWDVNCVYRSQKKCGSPK